MITVNLCPNRSRCIPWKTTATPSIKSRLPSKPSASKPCLSWSSRSSKRPKSGAFPQRKKQRLRRKGYDTIQIKTLHGVFAFAEQRLVLSDGLESKYLVYTGQ